MKKEQEKTTMDCGLLQEKPQITKLTNLLQLALGIWRKV